MGVDHEVKGSAFVTLRKWLLDERGPQALDAVVSRLEPTLRSALRDPLPSQWYPESTHSAVIHAVNDVLAHGDIAEYERIIHSCTMLGVHAFANLVLTMSSPSFVVKRAPTLYGLIRRGPSALSVSIDDHRAKFAYRSLPFFDDVLYRHYFRALLTALLTPSIGHAPDVQIAAHTTDSLDIAVSW